MTTDKACLAGLVCVIGSLLLWSGRADAGPIRIATGPSSSVDGYLDIAADEYGSWAVPFAGGEGPNDDHFNPLGAHDVAQAAFTSGFFLFVPDLSRRELLSDNADWQGVFAADVSLAREVTATNVASDSNGDLVDDTLTSSFRVFRVPLTDLAFDLTQEVSSVGVGVAVMRQDYTITNDGVDAITFVLVRTFDGDFIWDGDFANDEVGTTMHSAGVGTFVFEQEAADPSVTAVTLSIPAGGVYYGGKMGILPPDPPGGEPYAFGTDVQVWEAFGVPENWQNHIAGVGYDTDGVSGAFPPGSTPPEDGFIGADIEVTLASGACTTITVFHTYGQNTPVDDSVPLCDGDANGDGTVDPLDSGFVLARFGCPVCTGDPGCDYADQNGDGNVDPLDSGFVLARFGPCE